MSVKYDIVDLANHGLISMRIHVYCHKAVNSLHFWKLKNSCFAREIGIISCEEENCA